MSSLPHAQTCQSNFAGGCGVAMESEGDWKKCAGSTGSRPRAAVVSALSMTAELLSPAIPPTLSSFVRPFYSCHTAHACHCCRFIGYICVN